MEDAYMVEPFPDSKLIGAIRAVKGIRDSIAIIHGKSCCHSDSLILSLMTGRQDDIRITGSGIRLQDIFVGGYRKLPIVIRSTYENFRPDIIFVLITSFPTMMADDVDGIIDELKKDIPCEIRCINCAGHIGNMRDGYRDVLSFLERYVKENKKEERSVNLLGIKADDPNKDADIGEIKRLLASLGIKVNSIILDGTIKDIKESSKASLNLLFSEDALSFAEFMKNQFGIPFLRISYPYGIDGTKQFLKNVTDALNLSLNEKFIQDEEKRIKERLQGIYKYLQGIYGISAIVVGEKEKAIPFSKFLENELGIETHVFPRESGDQIGLRRLIEKIRPDILFGSSFEKEMCRKYGIPIVKIFFPVIDEIFIADIPYMGFRGTIGIVQKIINSIIGE